MNRFLSVVIVFVLLGAGVAGVTYFANQNKGGLNFATNESVNDTSKTSNDTSDTALDADLGSIALEDPTMDFTSVDSDISSL